MKKALVIGIDNYQSCPLYGCVNDAEAMSGMLQRHADGSPNFDVKFVPNVGNTSELRCLIHELFNGNGETALLYFSGHGTLVANSDGYIVAPDYGPGNEGVSFREILSCANESHFRNRVVMLDCCHAGNLSASRPNDSGAPHIATGVAVIAACRSTESAIERDGHGVVTSLMLEGLRGGAATVSGEVTPGGLYAFVDRSLGAWEQRPIFAANLDSLVNLRSSRRMIPPEILRKLPIYFSEATSEYQLDPSYEDSNCEERIPTVVLPVADAAHVAILKDLQRLESVGIVRPVGEAHMYYAAMHSKTCELTPLGRHVWNLVSNGRI